jgi:hypothetical protein
MGKRSIRLVIHHAATQKSLTAPVPAMAARGSKSGQRDVLGSLRR